MARRLIVTKSAELLGVGIYARAEAARLIRVTPTRLRRWVGGYRYWYRYMATETRRKRPAVVKRDLPNIDGNVALSFVELMELRVIKALIDKDISLQHIRVVAALMAEHFNTRHPFASQRVFTDGKKVFAGLTAVAVPDLVEISRERIRQVIAGGIFEPFLEEIDFDPATALAERWWPLGKSNPILLDPRVAFGAPTIAGTRIRTTVIAGFANKTSAEETAKIYDIPPDSVLAAIEFESQLAAA